MLYAEMRRLAMLHHANVAWRIRRGAGAKRVLEKYDQEIAPFPARPIRMSPLVARWRAWMAAGWLGDPSSRDALSSGEVGKLSRVSCLNTGALMFLGDGMCAQYHNNCIWGLFKHNLLKRKSWR